MSSNELNVKYGMYCFPERVQANTSLGYIYRDMNSVCADYVSLGFHLIEFRQYEYYKDFGYVDFRSFCDANIQMKYSSIMRCIQVCNEFSDDGKMFLSKKYKDYSYSQLVEMVTMSSGERVSVSPDMSVKSIRDLKKTFREKAVKPKEESFEPEPKEKFSSLLPENILKEIFELLDDRFQMDVECKMSNKFIRFEIGESVYRLKFEREK